MKLYLNFECVLTPAETDALRELVKRRGQREPLQHITGSTSFCGFEIAVNRHALVPRPETELLAESGWQFLQQLLEGRVPRAPNSTENGASQTPPSEYWISARAPAASPSRWRRNAQPQKSWRQTSRRRRSRWQRKTPRTTTSPNGLNLCQATALPRFAGGARVPRAPDMKIETKSRAREARPSKNGFDLIISNPPYIPSAEIATLQPEVREFDPRGALDGGADGLDFYRKLAAEAKPFLKPGGKSCWNSATARRTPSETFLNPKSGLSKR